MGSTLARYAAAGVETHYACATRGEVGEVDPELLRGYEDLGALRTAELTYAAHDLGLTAVHFLGYRDSGMPGDQVVERIVREAPGHLTDGGWLQVLANWAILRDQPWDDRIGSWLRAGDDALVVQREVLDPAAYVELWLKDAGLDGTPGYLQAYDAWLGWLENQGIEGVGFGWINVRAKGGGARELLEWPYDVEQPIAPAIAEWGEAAHVGDDLVGARLVARPDLVQETQGPPGATDPATIAVRQQRGLRRARQVDTVEAALIGTCDGDLSVGQILDALATILDRDPADLRAAYLPVVADLVREGFLQR